MFCKVKCHSVFSIEINLSLCSFIKTCILDLYIKIQCAKNSAIHFQGLQKKNSSENYEIWKCLKEITGFPSETRTGSQRLCLS